MNIEIRPLDAASREDFFRLHSETHGAGWCRCVAWWVESFAGWGERSADQNRALREQVMDRGRYDGYLLYEDGQVRGWCQCCPRDWLEHLRRRYDRPPDAEVWAIACFFVAPDRRRQGLARRLLAEVLADLRRRGVRRLEAYPKRGGELPAGEAWTGPEALFRKFGFFLERDDAKLPVYVLNLEPYPTQA